METVSTKMANFMTSCWVDVLPTAGHHHMAAITVSTNLPLVQCETPLLALIMQSESFLPDDHTPQTSKCVRNVDEIMDLEQMRFQIDPE